MFMDKSFNFSNFYISLHLKPYVKSKLWNFNSWEFCLIFDTRLELVPQVWRWTRIDQMKQNLSSILIFRIAENVSGNFTKNEPFSSPVL